MPRSQRTSCSYSSVDTAVTQALQDHDEELFELPVHTQQSLFAKVNKTVHYVLESMANHCPSRTHWRPNGVKKDITYYADDHIKAGQYRFCCVAETSARTEDILQLFVASDTETLVKHNRIVYDNVLDARVLSVLQAPTRFSPYKSVYVRYTSLATPKLMDDRDMCVVVATDVVVNDDGSMMGYCLWDSVEIPECPERNGLVRKRMFRSGFFCHTTPDTGDGFDHSRRTKIMYLVGVEAGGAAPRLAAWLDMEKFGAVVGRLCSYFRRKHLDPATFRPRSEWPSSRSRTHCRRCTKAFGRFSTRQHCVACGEVFCKACYVKERVDVPGVGITSERFCFQCLDIRGVDRHEARLAETTRLKALQREFSGSPTRGSSVFTFTTTQSTNLAHLDDGELVIVAPGSSRRRV